MDIPSMPSVRGMNLRLETTPPRLTVIHGDQGITVDSTAPRREVGILGWFDRLELEKSQQKESYDKGIARIVSEGNRLARIQDGGNPIAEIAASRLDQYFLDHQVVIGAIPETPPSITIRYSPTTYRVERGTLQISYGREYGSMELFV